MPLESRCINLPPGEIIFYQEKESDADHQLKTILGSCVAVTIWHAQSRVAGMCHYLLAQESEHTKVSQIMQKYRYGEEALDYLLKKMMLLHPLNEYELALFGGSNMYPSLSSPSIGEINVNFAKKWAKENNLVFSQEDTLGSHGRSVTLDLSTGMITLNKYRNNKGGLGEH